MEGVGRSRVRHAKGKPHSSIVLDELLGQRSGEGARVAAGQESQVNCWVFAKGLEKRVVRLSDEGDLVARVRQVIDKERCVFAVVAGDQEIEEHDAHESIL